MNKSYWTGVGGKNGNVEFYLQELFKQIEISTSFANMIKSNLFQADSFYNPTNNPKQLETTFVVRVL